MNKILGIVVVVLALTGLAGCAGALHDAAARGDLKTIKTTLDDGADINQSSVDVVLGPVTPLQVASKNCQIAAVKYLLEKGADVNINAGNIPGNVRYTALRIAADNGCNEAIKLLLNRGAEIDARDRYGNTPLISASVRGQRSTVKLLVERGADADYAIGRLVSNEKKTAAQFIEQAVKEVHEGKTQIATNKDSYTAVARTDIDEIPVITSEMQKNAYAVVIGIENYRSIPKSDYSRSDATLVKAYLKALGFQERNIELLTDDKASRSDIEKSLEAWLPNKVKKDSTVFVYFSGHGAPEPSTGNAYLVPYDGDPNYLPVTGYSLKRLYENLGKLGAKEVIVVLDSCFSGAGGRSVLAKGARPLVMLTTAGVLAPNMVVMSATQGSQISTSSPDKGHGVFTYYFLKAIRDGKKDIADIYEQIVPQVEDEAKKLNVEQSPSVSPDAEKLKGKFSLGK